MARFVIAGSKGTDNPTKATLTFIAAKDQGHHHVVIWFQGKTVVLVRKGAWIAFRVSACQL